MKTIQFLFGLIIMTIILGCAVVDMTPPVQYKINNHDCACLQFKNYYA